jgi:hypothetical protein
MEFRMRYVFRALAIVAALGFVFNLSVAQKALKELPEGSGDDLGKEGDREAHQGADNPRQGNASPDPYGAESYQQFIEKAERQLNNPQWQLKLDLQDPKRIVVNHADGRSEEYWYVLFRVINDNTRNIKQTTLPGPDTKAVDLDNPPSPREVQGGVTDDMEGVPVDCHLDFEFHVFNRNIEADPWDLAFPEDPDDPVLTPEQIALRRAQMKHVFRPISDHSVLQLVAEKEGLYEWMGNYGHINEAVMLLHPLSDFQRQIGFAHDLKAPDLSGLRCVPYRIVVVQGGERTEAMRYVAVYDEDNTFAGVYGQGDTLPDGARLVDKESDEMYGKLTQRRYMAGDCIDRDGRPLRANEPGYLNARIAGSQDGKSGSFGVVAEGHPLVGKPVMVPHYRMYRDSDKVLVDWDTGVKHADFPNTNYRITGKIVGPADPRFGDAKSAGELDAVGKPVKMVDGKGRAIRKYIVTYEAGDRITQAEWDIYSQRLGKGLLVKYKDLESITSRPLTPDDPLIGMPKIKMGSFTGDAANGEAEVIQRGVDTGRRGPEGEVILDLQEYVTGRRFDPKKINPEDFARDPEGEFSTNREAPIPPGAKLDSGEEYVYAPLGNATEDAVPVPAFDQYGAWEDYYDELSGSRIPMTDKDGALVRNSEDQILYVKEFEYEYVYMYEYALMDQDDDGFKGEYGGDRYELRKESIKFTRSKQKVRRLRGENWVEEEVQIVLPLVRLIWEERDVREPDLVDGYQYADPKTGTVQNLTPEEFETASGIDLDATDEATKALVAKLIKVKIVTSKLSKQEIVIGVYNGDDSEEARKAAVKAVDKDGKPIVRRAESWAQAETRATTKADGTPNPDVTIESRDVIRYVNRFRNDQVAKNNNEFEGTGPTDDEYDQTDVVDNGIDMTQTYKTYSRWTVPPPMVYRDDNGEWQVLTRLADKIGPANRWDGTDAPRFLTRYISEMWGVAIFKGVNRDWDYANVYVRGLRGSVSNAGLTLDASVPDMPSPADGTTPEGKSFFNPRYVEEEWVYRVRFERLGDEFENYRDLIRRVRTFWYRESDKDLSGE